MDPNRGEAHIFLGRSYKQKRMYEEALAELKTGKDLLGDNGEVLSLIGYTYAGIGHRILAIFSRVSFWYSAV